MAKTRPHRYEVSFEHDDGKTYTGSYTVESGVVTVTSSYGSKATQLGRTQAEQLARLMLRELVIDYKSR